MNHHGDDNYGGDSDVEEDERLNRNEKKKVVAYRVVGCA